MFEEERLQKIAKYVQSKARASVRELCGIFGISESTARRDLIELENRKLLRRTHGGAVFLEPVGLEPTYPEKEDRFRSEKESIARRAAALIEDGDSLVVDAGTTTLCLAEELARFQRLTVVTNSIYLSVRLASLPNVCVVSTGGVLRKNTMAFAGPAAETMLAGIHADKAFLAANGLDLRYGLSTPSMEEAAVKRKMMEAAGQAYVLADHSKFGRIAFAKFGALSEIDACITGAELPEEQLQEYGRGNVKILLAGN